MSNSAKLKESTVQKIYTDIFKNIYRLNIDVFLCGGASNKKYTSTRDKVKPLLLKQKHINVLYPEDLFMELLQKKSYDLLSLEKFLADNCDYICIVCESPGSFVELGAFVNNQDTFEKVIALVQTKYKTSKSFIMMGPIRHIQSSKKNNVIFYGADVESSMYNLLEIINKQVSPYLPAPKIKDIDLISGQYYLIILILFFYRNVEIKSLISEIKNIYNTYFQHKDKFDIIYTAAIKRLYKEGIIEKGITGDVQTYHLSDKGYMVSRQIVSSTRISNRTRVFDSIRLSILKSQYY